MKTDDFIMMPIPSSAFTAVCALLGGASITGLAVAGHPLSTTALLQPDAQPQPEPAVKPGPAENIAPVGDQAQTNGDEIDAGGHVWSADLHASTKGKTKDGFWRMKVGVSRPAPLPGFPLDAAAGGTGTASNGTGSTGGASAASGAAGLATGEDEDEFAAFRAAADKVNATDAAAAAAVPARKWTDADLGALCNQAAVKLGDPAPVKALIAQYVPEGQVPHSRNIPDANRETFAKAVETAAGITFAG